VTTEQCEEVKQIYLLEELMSVAELSKELKGKIWDTFVNEPPADISKHEPPPPNPIDYAIQIAKASQRTIVECIELLEVEIIAKIIAR